MTDTIASHLEPHHLDRYLGALFGLAAGDALGTALEFAAPGTFTPITEMTGGGPFGLTPGQWTDDTSMALCLAESLVVSNSFDPADQMRRYVRWYREGYLSSTGACFDIGIATRSALHRFERTGEPYSGSTDPMTAGNGSLMRLAPVPMAFARYPKLAVSHAADSSRTTHAAIEAVDACRYMAGLIVGALAGVPKEELLSDHYSPTPGLWNETPLTPAVTDVARGSFKRRQPPEIEGSGYVVRSLEAALWAFYHATDFRSGALLAVNLGDDADTTGAVYGQLAGAYCGVKNIPREWYASIAHGDIIARLAEELAEMATGGT